MGGGKGVLNQGRRYCSILLWTEEGEEEEETGKRADRVIERGITMGLTVRPSVRRRGDLK